MRSIATRVAVDMYPAARGARAMALCVERRTDDGERQDDEEKSLESHENGGSEFGHREALPL